MMARTLRRSTAEEDVEEHRTMRREAGIKKAPAPFAYWSQEKLECRSSADPQTRRPAAPCSSTEIRTVQSAIR